MYLRRLIAGAALSFCLVATADAAGLTKAQLAKVEPGMTRAQLSELLGSPQKRTFAGRMEAFQYCSTGLVNDEYTTVWLLDGKVAGLDTEKRDSWWSCEAGFPQIDWSGAPMQPPPSAPDQAASGGAATGTAFKVGATALMTAAHVVENTTKIDVRCPGMPAMPATVVQRSRATDIAVLSVATASTKWLPVASTADVALGDPVFVIGFPVSDLLGTNPRFNDGTISALSGIDSDASFLQISAPIQPGNSGGPVVSPTRGVVGIVSSSAAAANFVKGTGGALPQNINFAARADLSLNLDRTLKTGVGPVSVDDALASTCFVQVQLAS